MANRKRRGRGEGGIRYREDKGLWVAEVRSGAGHTRRTVYGKTTKEVQGNLRKLHNEVAAGIGAEAAQLTVGQWLTRWLEHVQPTVEPNTYGPYERHVRLDITPHIGNLKLAKLTKAQVRGWYAALAKAGVSPALQRKVGTTLTIALNQAVSDDVIPGNPALKIRKPKVAKTEIQVLDPDQIAAFLEAAKADRLFAFYVMALDTGMRPGELFALAWTDLDMDGGFVRVTKSLERIGDKHRVKEAKTAKSRRRIDLSADTVAALAEHRQAMLAEGHITGPVFCNTTGGYIRISDLHKDSFKLVLKKAKLPEIRLYDRRHTSATLLLLADVPAKVVSERLGHSTITLTLDTYSHVLPTMQRRAADLMGQILGRKPTDDGKVANGGIMAVQG
jgi:integrase